ncbi:hypothetical protein B5C34_06220 [Pacificimonas flava]|uniref:Glycosyltransferase n=2 Tax=Pacificimonas TaxID=1960290 RepID=A0A219B5M5_9SPHN|nr:MULTISPECIES: TIGR04282 family arsenosugar biosynthesis glycosyltransferase [Pacificimonas]MBZ6377179.1 TIGR04282 family arsenosugar biosynthesis glycosyltransferase [Pacificimonas aurantium]OWV33099.1 hypothetical protein B5C34_06220 [Pacificimonas flava]
MTEKLPTATLRPIIFARYPHSGQCKTRLIPALGADGAAELHRRLVERTLARLADLSPILSATGAQPDAFARWLGPIELRTQGNGDLGTRMRHAARNEPALIVGSDIPDIDPAQIVEAAQALHSNDLVLGPAEDGGFWLIAAKSWPAKLFEGVAWGRERACSEVTANADRLGWRTRHIGTLADLDRPEDLERWPALDPRR